MILKIKLKLVLVLRVITQLNILNSKVGLMLPQIIIILKLLLMKIIKIEERKKREDKSQKQNRIQL